MTANSRIVFGVEVRGISVDRRTGCIHYRSTLDVIAIKHRCCQVWYACIECHNGLADHASDVWRYDEFENHAILCGMCGAKLTISQYLANSSRCPSCRAAFNPGCSLHHHLYFEVPTGD